MTHTPTPYEIYGATLIWSPTGKQMVATVSEPEPKNGSVSHEKVELLSQNFNLACANAAFIVKACNNWQEAIALLEENTSSIRTACLDGKCEQCTWCRTEAFLAKAEVSE